MLLCSIKGMAQKNVFTDSSTSYYVGPIFAFTQGEELRNTVTPMLAMGMVIKNVAIEVDLGRSNMNFSTKPSYFWELRCMPSVSINQSPFKVFGVLGIGNTFGQNIIFLIMGQV